MQLSVAAGGCDRLISGCRLAQTALLGEPYCTDPPPPLFGLAPGTSVLRIKPVVQLPPLLLFWQGTQYRSLAALRILLPTCTPRSVPSSVRSQQSVIHSVVRSPHRVGCFSPFLFCSSIVTFFPFLVSPLLFFVLFSNPIYFSCSLVVLFKLFCSWHVFFWGGGIFSGIGGDEKRRRHYLKDRRSWRLRRWRRPCRLSPQGTGPACPTSASLPSTLRPSTNYAPRYRYASTARRVGFGSFARR